MIDSFMKKYINACEMMDDIDLTVLLDYKDELDFYVSWQSAPTLMFFSFGSSDVQELRMYMKEIGELAFEVDLSVDGLYGCDVACTYVENMDDLDGMAIRKLTRTEVDFLCEVLQMKEL